MSNIQTDLFTKSKTLVPGGVHSPVRSFKGLTSTPRFFNRAEGAYIYDVEDKNYIDFCIFERSPCLSEKHRQQFIQR